MSQSLHEAIMQVAGVQQKQETNTNPDSENLVYEYLSSFFGVDLNESYDELTEEDFENAVSAINVLRNAVNEYFELDEDNNWSGRPRRVHPFGRPARKGPQYYYLHKHPDTKKWMVGQNPVSANGTRGRRIPASALDDIKGQRVGIELPSSHGHLIPNEGD